jgi:hypothetical protein
MRYAEIGSLIAFLASAGMLLAMTRRQRITHRKLEQQHTHYLADRLLERSYLFSGDDEQARAKLERVLEDIDQEWANEHRFAPDPGAIEKLAAYLGNTEPRSTKA